MFWILKTVSWRTAFAIFGLLGAIWAIFFYRWFRDNPADNPKVNRAELELLKHNHHGAHGSVPWAKFASSKQAWLLGAQYFCLS